MRTDAPDLALVHRWLDSWRGVGLLAVGLHRVGYDLDLRQYGDGLGLGALRRGAPCNVPAGMQSSMLSETYNRAES